MLKKPFQAGIKLTLTRFLLQVFNYHKKKNFEKGQSGGSDMILERAKKMLLEKLGNKKKLHQRKLRHTP